MASETGNQGIYEPVPLMAPLRSFEEQEDEIIQGVSDVIRSGMWVYSNHGKALEEELNEFVGSEKSAVVASGTDALILALEGYGVKPGDEVITPAYSFFASASTIMLAGATPVFCDVSERTFNIDPDRIEEKITEKTVGIVAVHLYGLPADLDRINKIAEKHGLFVIEDACQAIGASVNGKKVGSGKN
ncbi:MAG TPA: aminotransferase class I/II-fold pyridoxal phosphate-dependent enzyme, partial [bacterium]